MPVVPKAPSVLRLTTRLPSLNSLSIHSKPSCSPLVSRTSAIVTDTIALRGGRSSSCSRPNHCWYSVGLPWMISVLLLGLTTTRERTEPAVAAPPAAAAGFITSCSVLASAAASRLRTG